MKSKKKRTTKTAGVTAVPGHGHAPDTSVAAREHYRREKAARGHRARLENQAMAAARREYLALLEADAAKGRGGRPRKKAAPPKPAELELFEDTAEGSDAE